MKPHKHADVIKQWAEGAKIESTYHLGVMPWADDPKPLWLDDYLYRIKPVEPEKVYPVSMIDGEELNDFLGDRSYIKTTYEEDLQALANHILRHACDNGQIVTREEFDRAVGDRKKRDLDVANAVDEAWRTKVLRLLPQVDHMSIARMVNLPLVLSKVKP